MALVNDTSKGNISLSVNTFNCRGLRCKSKRLSVFNWLNTTERGITLLQETHSDSGIEKQWEKELEGSIYFSHGTSSTKGVAILIPNILKSLLKVNEMKKDDSGRILVLHCEMAGTEVVIFNIYAPTKDLTQEQNIFLNSLSNFVEDYWDRNIILGGDFNICLNHRLDKNGGKTEVNSSYRINLIHFMEEYSLSDIWRIRNLDKL